MNINLDRLLPHQQPKVTAEQVQPESAVGGSTSYALGVGQAGYDRLEVSEETYGHFTTDLVAHLCKQRPRAWPQPPLRMAIAACGVGSQLSTLSHLAGPGAKIWCSDISPEQIALAQQTASRLGLSDVFFERVDLEAANFGQVFDVVHARFVLVHLQKPVEALQNLWEMVAPGGTLLSEEHAVSGIGAEPALEATETAKGWLAKLGSQRKVDFELGLRMPALFAKADVPQAGSFIHKVGFTAGKPKRLLEMSLREGVANYAKAGIASTSEVERVCNQLRDFSDRPDTQIFLGFFTQTWALKALTDEVASAYS